MSQLVLVDSSVWIDYFRGEPDAIAQLNALIDQNRVLISGLVLQEVLQGSRNRQAFEQLQSEMQIWEYEGERPEDFVLAARLFAELRWKGATLPPSDCLIASVALRLKVPLLARDAHFDEIARLKEAPSEGLRLL